MLLLFFARLHCFFAGVLGLSDFGGIDLTLASLLGDGAEVDGDSLLGLEDEVLLLETEAGGRLWWW